MGGKSRKPRKSGFADKLYQIYHGFKRQKFLKEKKRKEMKQRLSPERYELYLQNERRKEFLQAGFVVGVLLIVFLILRLVVGAVNQIIHPKEVFVPLPENYFETETETEFQYEEKDIVIGHTGSILLHGPVIQAGLQSDGTYNFDSMFKYVKDYYEMTDYMVCEFEGTLGGPERGYSGYPSFSAPDQIITAIHNAGVDLQLNATNHMYDGLHKSLLRTNQVYTEKNIAHTGIRGNTSEKTYYIADIDGVSVGFINYVYEEDGSSPNDGDSLNQTRGLNAITFSQEDVGLINTFDYNHIDVFYTEMEQAIKNMKQEGAQFIIANMHWGTEYQTTQNQQQETIAKKLCDLGIDAIIGGHPHVVQPMDVITGTDASNKILCCYSTGNELSNQRRALISESPNGYTEDGVIIYLTLHQDWEGTVTLKDVNCVPTWVLKTQYSDGSNDYFILPLDETTIGTYDEEFQLDGVSSYAQQSYDRTMGILQDGMNKAKETFCK